MHSSFTPIPAILDEANTIVDRYDRDYELYRYPGFKEFFTHVVYADLVSPTKGGMYGQMFDDIVSGGSLDWWKEVTRKENV